jgi:hypothetical protein
MTKVTYSPPNEPGAPASLIWNDITFQANVPVELDPDNRAHGYLVPVVNRWFDPATQEPRTKATEKWMSMIDIARTNKSFIVEGEPIQRRSPGRPRAPKTSDEYRDHARTWISAAEDVADLERWNEEQALREKCGVGDDDLAFLRPFFDAKLHELKGQAA